MKKFFLMVLLVSVFFTGLGGMLRETAAKFKSDERALALLQKARQAIGGENAVGGVNSLVITGRSTRIFKIDGTERSEQGDMEIALQLPDKMMKMIKMGHEDGAAGEKSINKQVDVVVVRNGEGKAEWKSEPGEKITLEGGQKIKIKKEDGTVEKVQGGDGETIVIKKGDGAPGDKKMVFDREVSAGHGAFPRNNELLRTTLALLLTAPQSMDVNYLYAGEGTVDGAACNIIDAQFGGASIKLYLGKDSNLPVMMAYTGAKLPMMIWTKKDEAGAPGGEKEVKVFHRKIEAPEMAEFQVRFSDYRSVNGVLLPHRWTQTAGGQADETVEVSGYEINPANINDKFKAAGDTKTFVRKAKESSN